MLTKLRKLVFSLIIGLLLLGGIFFAFSKYNSVFALPGNMVKTKLTEGMEMPTDFAFAPDGRIFITEKGGSLKILKPGAASTITAGVIQAANEGERGLLGIALDPQFAVNNFIYVYYVNRSPLEIRVSRMHMHGDTLDMTDEVVLLRSNQQAIDLNHHAGTVRVGPDGKLYISVGNNTLSTNSQDLSNIHGKILRINKDGSIPEDNPFVGNASARPEIWAYGLRNPFRFSFAPDGSLYVGDVGEGSWEEINKVVKGGNYGFPHAEGACNNCGSINPYYQYPHNNQSASVTGGLVYSGSTLPEEYKNNYFFADYAQGFIKRIVLDSAGNYVSTEDFDPEAGTVVEMLQGPDGAIYFLNIFPGELYRVGFSTENQAPKAKISADKTSGNLPLTVAFSSNGSSDPEGRPLNYKWDFGNGQTSTEQNPVFTYTQAGTYTAKLVVNDGSKDSPAETVTIHAGNLAPQINLIKPAVNTKYNAGQTIQYEATATDSEDGELPASAYTWSIEFHHSTHMHPFIENVTNVKSGTFTIPDVGEPSSDVWYRVILKVRDSKGLETTTTRDVIPNKIKLTVNSNTPGLAATLDGAPITTPYTTDAVVGLKRVIGTSSPQSLNGNAYEFSNWSDNGARTHQIVTPSVNTTYTANFTNLGAGVGSMRFRIQDWNDQGFSGGFVNEATVKLTDTLGQTVYQVRSADAEGWVQFDNLVPGTYGILAYKAGYEGVWKMVDCNTPNGSTVNAMIQNPNTQGYKAAWDNHARVEAGKVTVCEDLGLKQNNKGHVYMRVAEGTMIDGQFVIKNYINDATVKVTDVEGQNVVATIKTRSNNKGEDGWAYLENIPAGTYGLMAYKPGYEGAVKMINCSGELRPGTINNNTAEGLVAAWNQNITVVAGKVNICYDLGLVNKNTANTGSLRFRISEFYQDNGWKGFVNGATVKLTSADGTQVFDTKTSGVQNGEDGWVFFDNKPVGTYGIMAYKPGYEGVWKMSDCTNGATFTNASINNANTAGNIAAWDNNVVISNNQITVCKDLGLKEKVAATGGSVRFRVVEFDDKNQWTGKFMNGVTVKLTDQSGNTVLDTKTSSTQNGEDGWVFFDQKPAGTYGILAYKAGYEGVWKMNDCMTTGGSFTNATIKNGNTEGLTAAFDNLVHVTNNTVTVCQDLGLKAEVQKGSLAFRIEEFHNGGATGNYLNDVTVKLTDVSGNTVHQTFQTKKITSISGDGWAYFENVPAGTYGIMAYKDGFSGIWKQLGCQSNGGSKVDATIQNQHTEGKVAAWNNNVVVQSGQLTVCQDLGVQKSDNSNYGSLRLRVREFNAQNQWTGGYVNDVSVAINLDTSGFSTQYVATSGNKAGGDGWVWFDNRGVGNYSLALSGASADRYQIVWVQTDCREPDGVNGFNQVQTAAISGGKVTTCEDIGVRRIVTEGMSTFSTNKESSSSATSVPNFSKDFATDSGSAQLKKTEIDQPEESSDSGSIPSPKPTQNPSSRSTTTPEEVVEKLQLGMPESSSSAR